MLTTFDIKRVLMNYADDAFNHILQMHSFLIVFWTDVTRTKGVQDVCIQMEDDFKTLKTETQLEF